MTPDLRRCLSLVFVLVLTACGGGSSTPTTPTTPGGTNRVPVVSSVTVNPPFGIQDKTPFSFSASATDPDGDPLTYAWSIGGSSFTGSNVAITFVTGGALSASVTVSDGRGGSTTGSQTFVVGTLAGAWAGTAAGLGNFTMSLTHTNGEITGTYSDLDGPAQVGPPGARGTMDASGNFELPTEQAQFAVFTLRGTMDATGRRITGGFFGSGFTGESFTMDKQ
jgi:PKD domain-containing protein